MQKRTEDEFPSYAIGFSRNKFHILSDAMVLGECMQPYNLIKKVLRNVRGIEGFITRNEMSHFQKMFHNHKSGIVLLVGLGKSNNKVHANVFPCACGIIVNYIPLLRELARMFWNWPWAEIECPPKSFQSQFQSVLVIPVHSGCSSPNSGSNSGPTPPIFWPRFHTSIHM